MFSFDLHKSFIDANKFDSIGFDLNRKWKVLLKNSMIFYEIEIKLLRGFSMAFQRFEHENRWKFSFILNQQNFPT